MVKKVKMPRRGNYLIKCGFWYPKFMFERYNNIIYNIIPKKEQLLRRGLPIIYRPHDLGEFLDVELEHLIKYASIKKSIDKEEELYEEFLIPKKSGGFREIVAPIEELKRIQRKIYDEILKKVKLSKFAHGFRENRSIVTNAKVHHNLSTIYRIDISDFFPSIKFKQILDVFLTIGYSGVISFLLSSLCSRVPRTYLNLLKQLTIVENEPPYLPQGCPTSPALSNLICTNLDVALNEIAKRYGFVYSRYADDLAFSSSYFTISLSKFRYKLIQCIKNYGFSVNLKKERFSYNHKGDRIICGIVAHKDYLACKRKFIKNLRAALHQLEGYIYELNENPRKINELFLEEIKHLTNSINGRIAFTKMVNPKKYKRFAVRFGVLKNAISSYIHYLEKKYNLKDTKDLILNLM